MFRQWGSLTFERAYFNEAVKHFFFLNYVNINSFRSYSLSTFILLVFVLLVLKYKCHKTSMKLFSWFLFLICFSLNTSLWLQSLLVLFIGDVEINPVLHVPLRQTYQYAIGISTVYLLTIMLNPSRHKASFQRL